MVCENEEGKEDLPSFSPSLLTSQWMTNLPENLTKIPMTRLAMPGSHNTGAYYLDPTTPISPDKSKFIKTMGNCNKNVVINWSLCQSCTITEQLKQGVRYFDMRPGFIDYEDEFFCVHGVHGKPIPEMLWAMRGFLVKNPREIIVVDFNHFHKFTVDLHARLVKMILHIFSGMLYTHKQDSNYTVAYSLADMWKVNKQILLTYKQRTVCKENREFWSTECIFSPWFNTDCIPHLIDRLNHLHHNLKPHKLNVFQAILTPRKLTIALNPTSTLRECLVQKCNTAIKEWLINMERQCIEGVNIVICDFICDEIIEMILKLNHNIKV